MVVWYYNVMLSCHKLFGKSHDDKHLAEEMVSNYERLSHQWSPYVRGVNTCNGNFQSLWIVPAEFNPFLYIKNLHNLDWNATSGVM